MATRLHRFGLLAGRHRWLVIGVWLLVVALVAAAIAAFGSDTSNNLRLPGTDSQAATDLLAERFPPQQNGSNPIVFRANQGKVTHAANERAIKRSRAALLELDYVYSAPSPFGKRSGSQISKDERTALIPVLLRIGNAKITDEIAASVLDAAEPARRAGMRVAAGGSVGSELSEPATESSELVGLTAAMIILAFTFGSLVAMGMPIISGLLGLVVGLGLIGLLGHLVQVPTIGPTLATMIGLGVGIDYALFLVSRYRTEVAGGTDRDEAVAIAVATSGTAIVFAGTTVVIALVTLLIAGIPLVTTLGYSAAVAVVTAVLAAISLLPAVLAAVGGRIDSLRLPRFLRPAPKPRGTGAWAAWARFVTGRPWLAVAIALALLVPLIVPVLSLNLGQEDVGATPKSTTERQAYDLIASGFGVGYNGPLLVAVELGTPARPSKQFKQDKQQAESLQAKLEAEQAQGEAEQASLSSQAEALEGEQAAIEAEAAALGARAGEIGTRRAQIESERDRLAREDALREQLSALVADAKPIARRGAKLAAEQEAIERALKRLASGRRKVEARLENATSPEQRERLTRRLEEIDDAEQALRAEEQRVEHARRQNERRARDLSRRAARLRERASGLGAEAVALSEAAAAATAEAASVELSMGSLRQAATDTLTEAASLEQQAADLEGLQQKAKRQQQQGGAAPAGADEGADPGGGRRPGHRSPPGRPPEGAHRHDRRQRRLTSGDQRIRQGRGVHGDPDHGPGRRRDGGPRRHLPRVRDPRVDRRHRRRGARRRADRELRRPRLRDLGDPGAGDRRRRRARLPRPADGLPLGAGRRPGGDRERALGDRGVRRRDPGLPGGVGHVAGRARDGERHRPDRELRAADHVRGPVRALDGLPGVPDEPDRARTGRPATTIARRSPRGPGDRRAGDLRGGPDHDLRLRQLHPQRRPDREAVRGRALGRGRRSRR